MNAPATERRFVCPACEHAHLIWTARCAGCSSLKGLRLETGVPAGRGFPLPPPPDFEEEPREIVRLPRPPRLTIARPAPQPELTDPQEELVDLRSRAPDRGPILISEIAETTFVRILTGLPGLDHVLGGGLVGASVVLLASPRGIGKTTLTLQMLDGLQQRGLYITGEETEGQVAATARRIGAVSNRVYLYAERNLDNIFMHARAMQAQTIVIDSIQKMICPDVSSRAGSTTQLKECTARLVEYAKSTNTVLWIIGHVTGEGDVAGPTTIEHDVDVIIELECGPKFEGNERILKCPGKNRFGATSVVAHFELTPKGFASLDADGWNEKL